MKLWGLWLLETDQSAPPMFFTLELVTPTTGWERVALLDLGVLDRTVYKEKYYPNSFRFKIALSRLSLML